MRDQSVEHLKEHIASNTDVDWAAAAERGEPIRVSDMMIATVARSRNERLVAADEHFERVKGLD